MKNASPDFNGRRREMQKDAKCLTRQRERGNKNMTRYSEMKKEQRRERREEREERKREKRKREEDSHRCPLEIDSKQEGVVRRNGQTKRNVVRAANAPGVVV